MVSIWGLKVTFLCGLLGGVLVGSEVVAMSGVDSVAEFDMVIVCTPMLYV